MSRRRWAYAAYVLGSAVFLVAAVVRGSPLLVVGSALFLLGTLLFVPEVTPAHRDARRTGSRDGADGG